MENACTFTRNKSLRNSWVPGDSYLNHIGLIYQQTDESFPLYLQLWMQETDTIKLGVTTDMPIFGKLHQGTNPFPHHLTSLSSILIEPLSIYVFLNIL